MSRHGPYPPAHQSSSRNPWNGAHCSESLSSSASSQTYHMVHPNPYVQMDPFWDVGGHQYQLMTCSRVPPVDPYRHPGPPPPLPGFATAVTPTGVFLLPKQHPPRPYHFTPVTDRGRRSHPVSSRALTPVSGLVTSETAILPCGGHCVALETFCHSFLQVAFVSGILAGVCLFVAGNVFTGASGRRGGGGGGGGSGGDLGVLTYIGVLVSLVSALLLSIQCCARRPRPVKKSRRSPASRLAPTPPSVVQPPPAPLVTTTREEIPLRDFHHTSSGGTSTTLHQPLLVNSKVTPHQTMAVLSGYDQRQQFKEENGIPWWRRENSAAIG